jgi:Ca2+-binding RTX toxin-like protein
MVTFSDPLFSAQWHFGLLGDINTIWNEYSGAGVTVGVYDDGVQFTHPDLNDNYNSALHFVYLGQVYNPVPISSVTDGHGTAVAGLIAAEAGNGIGGVGVAWGATITGVNLLADPRFFTGSGEIELAAFRHFAAFDVVNNSWGYEPYFEGFLDRGEENSYAFLVEDAFAYAVDVGRGGLGTLIVKSAGNEGYNANGEGLNGSRFVVSVAALDDRGQIQSYSNYGANILVSAGAASVTTDLTGTGGYNRSSGTAGNYTSEFGGTSAAAPVVSGVIALMLDANEDLGWRDVREILATSAALTGSIVNGNPSFEVDGTNFQSSTGLGDSWNDGGRAFSLDYGFGSVNAFAAVRMAEIWFLFGEAQTAANEQQVTASLAAPELVNLSFSDFILVDVAEDLRIENIDLRISAYLTTGFSDRLSVAVVSPDGTYFPVLLALDGIIPPADGAPLSWTFGISHALGLNSEGTWQIHFAANTGILNVTEVTLDFYGSAWDFDNVHHITQDFLRLSDIAAAGPRDRVINDTNGGNDWINMSAVAGAVTATLDGLGAISVGGEQWATIAAGAQIENIVTSDGADSLTGSSLDNQMYGMRGNDTIRGLGGNDTLDGGAGNDSLDGGEGNDTLNGGAGNDSLDGGSGNDSLDGGAGNDTLAGGAGDDTLVGGAGVDVASYATATADLTITLVANGQLSVAGFGTDSLSGIEGLEGGSGNDSLTGDAGANLLIGGAGNDTLTGGAGNDTLNGGLGADTASYAGAAAAVTVNLAITTAQSTGGAGTDLLVGIENLAGSIYGDVLTGSAAANRIEGGSGNDRIIGAGGADTLLGGEGDDLFLVGTFADHADWRGDRRRGRHGRTALHRHSGRDAGSDVGRFGRADRYRHRHRSDGYPDRDRGNQCRRVRVDCGRHDDRQRRWQPADRRLGQRQTGRRCRQRYPGRGRGQRHADRRYGPGPGKLCRSDGGPGDQRCRRNAVGAGLRDRQHPGDRRTGGRLGQ